MPYFANEYDSSTMGAIERWKLTAADEIDSIGGWRDVDPDSDNGQDYWLKEQAACGPSPDRAVPATMPRNFWSVTAYLVGRIANRYPKLDPEPLQKVYDAVAAWHEDRTAKRIPPQPVLFATLEQAMMVVGAVEIQIQTDVVQAYEPTEIDDQLFQEIRRFIFGRIPHFQTVGRCFDEAYSDTELDRRQVADKLVKHRQHRRNSDCAPVTRAGHRKRGFPIGCSTAAPERESDGRRERTPKYARFIDAVKDVADQMPKFALMKSVDKCALADRVLLMMWLISDPDADDNKTTVSNFQRWGWQLQDDPLWQAPEDKTELVACRDERFCRHWTRLTVFRGNPKWIDWVRQVWKYRQAADADPAGGDDQQTFVPTQADMEILQALAEANQTLAQVSIAETSGHSNTMVKRRLPNLEKAGMVHRPHGERKGYSITDQGRTLLALN